MREEDRVEFYQQERARVLSTRNDYYTKYPQKRLKARLKKHGLTVEQFLSMLEQQDYKCAICMTEIRETFGGIRDRTGQATIDHCHETGKVRGLTCHHCNTGMGLLRDDPVRMERAAAYLRSHL